MALAHQVVVEHLVTIGSVEEDAQVHVLVAEGVGPAIGEQRKRGTDVGAVVRVDEPVLVDILELEVAGPDGGAAVKDAVGGILFSLGAVQDIVEVLVHARDLIAVEAVQGLADFGHAHDIVPLSVTDELRVLGTVQGDELVLVEGDLEVALPLEIPGLDRITAEGDLETLVVDGSEITLRSGEGGGAVALRTHVGREVQRHEHVGRLLVVRVDGQVEPVVEEAEVDTHIDLLLLLPVDTRVGDVGRTLGVAEGGIGVVNVRLPGAAADIGVTGLSPAETDLTVADDIP